MARPRRPAGTARLPAAGKALGSPPGLFPTAASPGLVWPSLSQASVTSRGTLALEVRAGRRRPGAGGGWRGAGGRPAPPGAEAQSASRCPWLPGAGRGGWQSGGLVASPGSVWVRGCLWVQSRRGSECGRTSYNSPGPFLPSSSTEQLFLPSAPSPPPPLRPLLMEAASSLHRSELSPWREGGYPAPRAGIWGSPCFGCCLAGCVG